MSRKSKSDRATAKSTMLTPELIDRYLQRAAKEIRDIQSDDAFRRCFVIPACARTLVLR